MTLHGLSNKNGLPEREDEATICHGYCVRTADRALVKGAIGVKSQVGSSCLRYYSSAVPNGNSMGCFLHVCTSVVLPACENSQLWFELTLSPEAPKLNNFAHFFLLKFHAET